MISNLSRTHQRDARKRIPYFMKTDIDENFRSEFINDENALMSEESQHPRKLRKTRRFLKLRVRPPLCILEFYNYTKSLSDKIQLGWVLIASVALKYSYRRPSAV